MIKHTGSCHCGSVKFEVLAPADIAVSNCNCSVCAKSGHRGLIVPKERFTLLSGEADLSEYNFNTGVARHLFCRHCGIKSYYVPRSHPDGVSVNVNCLDAGTVTNMRVREFDGQNWERYYPSGRADAFPD